MLHVDGEDLVDDQGQKVVLHGVSFGNQVWSNVAVPTLDHTEADFQRVADMGMNAVRFYMNYVTFEDDAAPYVYKQAGWDWIDQNIAWAKAQGIRLVLNMHVPQGGFQSNGDGGALWDVVANQDRLVALWSAIAGRYAAEPTIAGYGLVNEPVTTVDRAQWKTLASRLVTAIREVDPHHVLFIERTNGVQGDYSADADMNFFLVDDPNVAYEFHFYEPIDYTHQLTSWTGLPEGGAYPDPTKIAGVTEKWLSVADFTAPSLPEGDSDWTLLVGQPLEASNPEIVVGKVSLVGASLGAGRASYDNLRVEEVDAEGNVLAEVEHLDPNTTSGAWFWSADGSGSGELEATGQDGTPGLAITGTTGDASFGVYSMYFRPTPGHSYRASGYAKGSALPAGAKVQVRLDFLGSSSPVTSRDRAGLETALMRYVSWGQAHGVPLFLGEYGLYRACFEQDRGGLTWVSDMRSLLAQHGLSSTYHTWHEDAFGLYWGSGAVDPTNANQPLIDLLSSPAP